MPRPGITPPMVEMMAPLPVASRAGCVLAGALALPTTSSVAASYEYIYGLFPTSDIAATFWRYSIAANAWQQMLSPTLDALDLLATACAMVVDDTNGYVYLLNSRNDAAGYVRFQAFIPAGNVWIPRSTIAGLAAPWTNGMALCRPCARLGFPAVDTFIYLCGNAETTMRIYNTGTNTWAISGGAARAGATGEGVALNWLPEAPDRILTQRGGNVSIYDNYTISTAAFTASGFGTGGPDTLLYTTGTETAADCHRNKVITQYTGRLYEAGTVWVAPTLGQLAPSTPLGTFYKADGTLHKGNGLVSIRIGGQSYVYWRKHSQTEFQRLEVLE
jgi:hypothetical protein